jgi:hypothetical protein
VRAPYSRALLHSWPLPFVLGLYLYFITPSRMMLPDDGVEAMSNWHPSYFGWYDVALLGPLLLSLYLSRSRPSATTLWAMGAAFCCLTLSVIGFADAFQWSLTLAASLYWLRFAAVFIVMIAIVRDCGIEMAVSIVIGLGLLLMISSLFVFSLQYGAFNRIYASGMTVGSFGQAMLLLAWVAIMRKRLVLAILASTFLLFTFSRTAVLLWCGGVMLYVSAATQIKRGRRWLSVVLIAAACGGAIYYITSNPEFTHVILDRLDQSSLESWSDRLPLWQFGNELITTGRIPIIGVGFGNTTWLLTEIPSQRQIPSFHSIVYEYAIGMGVLCLPIFAWLIGRIWKAFRSALLMPGMIYLLFLASQSVDFTFYRPKEVVLWAVFLGLAEGELQLSLQHKSRQAMAVSVSRGWPRGSFSGKRHQLAAEVSRVRHSRS